MPSCETDLNHYFVELINNYCYNYFFLSNSVSILLTTMNLKFIKRLFNSDLRKVAIFSLHTLFF